MGKCRMLWVVTVLCVTVMSLASQGVALANPESPASRGYALGFWGPGESAGYLSFHDGASVTALAADPASDYAEEVVRLINQGRKEAGLPPFKASSILTASAESHSVVMRDQDCFAHQCSGEPSSAERACNAGYGPYGWGDCFIGETIAAGFQDPASVVAAWMASPGHRDILLHGKLREIGVGYVTGGSYGSYWTTDFGSQPDVLPVFINYDDAETDTREVTLTLTNEEVSGWGGIDYAHEVMISNDPGFAGAQWEIYTQSKSWMLPPGEGSKTVYVKYQDPLGDETVSSDDILLNQPPEYDLELSTHSLIFTYQIDRGFAASPTGRVLVDNAASGSPMTWNANSAQPWVGLLSESGTTPGELVISVGGFKTDTLGTQQAVVTVNSPQSPNTPEEVTVTVRVVGEVHQVMLPFVTRTAQ